MKGELKIKWKSSKTCEKVFFVGSISFKIFLVLLIFFYLHLGYSFNFTTGGHTTASGGIVGKNQSTRSKTTVRSKRVGPLGSRWVPFTWFPQWYLLILLSKHFTSKSLMAWKTNLDVFLIPKHREGIYRTVCKLKWKGQGWASYFVWKFNIWTLH